ncbi:Oligosaccharide translocation protein rft1 [Mortierella claussenii]|nr:Oligosaccharide translocation protein rft1 [Mortierella claussenii]
MNTAGSALRQRSVLEASSASHDHHSAAHDVDLKSTTDEASSILSSSVQGASYLVLLQFVSRMLTFTLNQVLLRYTSAETLGIASVQLELLLNTILFLSREGVRCAAIRVSDDSSEEQLSAQAESVGEKPTDHQKQQKLQKQSTISPRPGSEAYRLQKLVNMVYTPIPVGALMTCLAVAYYLSQVDDKSESQFPGYRMSIYLYGLAALIELLAEPMFMVAQYKLWFKTRVSVEGTAVIVRCVLTCALTIYGARSTVVAHEKSPSSDGANESNRNTMGVLAFAIAQFVYALLTLGGFLLAFWSKSTQRRDRDRQRMAGATKKKDESAYMAQEDQNVDVISMRALLPCKLVRADPQGRPEYFFFDSELLKLSKTLTAQSLLKHILTEGDKMLMAGFTVERDQGVYAFVINYGSLIARILFQPMEETSRTLFSRLLSNVGAAQLKTTEDEQSTAPATDRFSPIHSLAEAQRANLVLSRNLLLTVMKFHILLGLIFISFGTHYTATLIDLVVGSYWSQKTDAPTVLSLYCWYVPIMGLNGITEAVVQAVASERELTVLSYWMIGFSAVFCSTGAFLMGVLGLGAKGIVLANCVNLTMRIIWSMWFLSEYYGRYIPAKSKVATTINAAAAAADRIPIAGKGRHAAKIFSYVPWRNIVPSPLVLSAFGAAYAVTAASEQWIGWDTLYNKAIHLGTGVVVFAITMGVVFVAEKPFLRDIQALVRQRRSDK